MLGWLKNQWSLLNYCGIALVYFLGTVTFTETANSAISEAPAPEVQRSGSQVNNDTVRRWNGFAKGLYKAHRFRLQQHDITTTIKVGGYHGLPKFFREVEYRDSKNDRLLSRVQWEIEPPGRVLSMEMYFYDHKGRLSVDYLVAFLPYFRNAPIQALINIYQHDGEHSAFRQFDASGNRTFERCWGKHFDQPVDLWLDDSDIPPSPEEVDPEIYTSCFGFLPQEVTRYLDPARMIPGMDSTMDGVDTHDTEAGFWEKQLATANNILQGSPRDTHQLLKRGDALFKLGRMEEAAESFDLALKVDNSLDDAYFGRGMALGRLGQITDGIADLTVYLRRNPNSSRGYTKRGVRHIWNRDFDAAETDLVKAIQLNDRNAEAHDDLGAVLVQTGRIDESIEHFMRTIELDPSYIKAHHNLAVALYLGGNHERALNSVDNALRLRSQVKSTMLLKSAILKALGRESEAETVNSLAEFLPDGNWSERSSLGKP